jgi:hypothetical protein
MILTYFDKVLIDIELNKEDYLKKQIKGMKGIFKKVNINLLVHRAKTSSTKLHSL